MYGVEHDFKYSVFKVVVYVKHEFNFFLFHKFLAGRWSVIDWSVGRWSVVILGWSAVLREPSIVGNKENQKQSISDVLQNKRETPVLETHL